MKKNSVKKNYLYNMSYQLLAIIIPLITTPYLSRILGSDGIGTYSYTLSIATYFVLLGVLGTNTYAQREIACFQDDEENRSKIFKEILQLRFITFTISILIFITFFCLFGSNRIYYRILTLEIFANMIDISWLFQGMEDFGKIVRKNLIVKIISIISIFVFIKSKNDVWIYVLIYSLSNFLGFLSLWLDAKKYIVKTNVKEKINIKKHIKGILLLFIPQVASTIYNVLDKTMLGLIVSDISYVGFYEQAQKITKVSLTVITSLGVVMLPRIANLSAKGDKKELKKNIYNSFSAVFLLAFPICFGLIAISDNLVPWFFGKGYEEVSLLIKICSPIVIFIGMANVMGPQYLLPTKQQNKYTLAVICSAVVNFVGNLLLISSLAAVAASITSVLAELVGVIIEFFYIRKDFSLKKILNLSKNYMFAGIIMLIALTLISNKLVPSIINTFILISIGGFIYLIMLLICKDEFVVKNINNIVKKLKVVK